MSALPSESVSSTNNNLKSSLEAFKFVSLRRSIRKRSQSIAESSATASPGRSDSDVLPTFLGSKSRNRTLQVERHGSSSSLCFPKSQDVDDSDSKVPQTPRKRRKSEALNGTPSPAKKIRRGFAPPEQYAHLNFLQDYLKEGLDVMFCGINPGYKSAEVGHHFANPTNHFWKCLYQSQLTDRLLPPSEDFTLPEAYNIGLTNLVDRPSVQEAELSKNDMITGVPVLLSKITRYKPRIICFVGKGIWQVFIKEASKLSIAPGGLNSTQLEALGESSESSRSGTSTPIAASVPGTPTNKQTAKKKPTQKKKARPKVAFEWGIQPVKVVHPTEMPALELSAETSTNASASNSKQGASRDIPETLFFVMPSTSGRVVSHQLPDKIKLFASLRERVQSSKNGEIDTGGMAVTPLPEVQPH